MKTSDISVIGKNVTKKNIGLKVKTFVSENTLLIIFIAMVTFLSITAKGFFTINNFINIIRQGSISGLVAIGVTYTILSGNIDLSVEGIVCLSGAVAAIFSQNIILSIGLAMLIGLGFGTLNAIILIKTNVQPFILTLGMSMFAKGIAMVIMRGQTIYGLSPLFCNIAEGEILYLPAPIVIFAIVVLLSYLLLNHSKFGRYVYATGSCEEAARLSGVKTKSIKFSVFLVSGLLAALAGIILTSRVNAAEPLAASGWSLTAVASVIVGGTSMRGGKGGVLNTVIGIMLMTVIDTGMIQLAVPTYYQIMIKGLVIILAILIDKNNKK